MILFYIKTLNKEKMYFLKKTVIYNSRESEKNDFPKEKLTNNSYI